MNNEHRINIKSTIQIIMIIVTLCIALNISLLRALFCNYCYPGLWIHMLYVPLQPRLHPTGYPLNTRVERSDADKMPCKSFAAPVKCQSTPLHVWLASWHLILISQRGTYRLQEEFSKERLRIWLKYETNRLSIDGKIHK